MTSTEQQFSRQPTLRRLVSLLLPLIVGIIAGIVLDRFILPHGSRVAGTGGNPNVTKDNYVKIQPEMTAWSINDILGSGEVISEQGFVVDAAGNFKKYNRQGGSYNQQTGTISGGKPSEEINQEVVWRDGERAIYVTFLNHKAVSKKEDGLYK